MWNKFIFTQLKAKIKAKKTHCSKENTKEYFLERRKLISDERSETQTN